MLFSPVVKELMCRSGLMACFRRLYSRNKVAILRYHAVVSEKENYYACSSICLDPLLFESQIKYFVKSFNIISLDTVAEVLREDGVFPERSLVLTFDDGYRDNFEAYKIMKKHGATATFYISSGCIGGGEALWLFEVHYLVNNTSADRISINGESYPTETREQKAVTVKKITSVIKSDDLATRERIREDMRSQMGDVSDVDRKSREIMLEWEQVAEMARGGMSIGGHTVTHLNLPNARHEDAVREIVECKREIEERAGVPVRHFSYPNGGNYSYYNESIKKAVKEAGYLTSTTSNNGVAPVGSDPYELFRIRVTGDLAEILYAVDCEYPVNRIVGR